MDEVIFEEFKGTGNMEITLDRALAEKRIWPAINIPASGTRKEEKLFSTEEMEKVRKLRQALFSMKPIEAMEKLLQKLSEFRSNGEFLDAILVAPADVPVEEFPFTAGRPRRSRPPPSIPPSALGGGHPSPDSFLSLFGFDDSESPARLRAGIPPRISVDRLRVAGRSSGRRHIATDDDCRRRPAYLASMASLTSRRAPSASAIR